MTERVAIVVIGMHRSGSSALARLLSLVGAALPTRLMTPTEWNETGHWEPQHVAEFNNVVLASVDATWDSPFGLGMNANRRAVFEPFVERARSILVEEYGDAPLIVLKEPRISLLADMWVKALEAENYTCKFVITLRSPSEVAASLRKRDGFPLDKGLLLWGAYQASSELLTRSYDRVFCRYDDVLTRPAAVIDEIEAALGIEFPRRTAKAQAEMDLFVRPDMKHNHAATIAGVPDYLGRIDEMSHYIDSLVAGEHPAVDVSQNLQEWLADLDRTVSPLLLDLEHRLRAEAADALSAVESRAGGYVAEIDRLNGLHGEQLAHVAARDAQVAELEAIRHDIEHRLAVAENERRTAQELLQAREAETTSLRAELEAATARAAGFSADMIRLETANAEASRALAGLSADLVLTQSNADAARLESHDREAALVAAAEACAAEKGEADTAYAALATDHARVLEEHAAALAALDAQYSQRVADELNEFRAREAELEAALGDVRIAYHALDERYAEVVAQREGDRAAAEERYAEAVAQHEVERTAADERYAEAVAQLEGERNAADERCAETVAQLAEERSATATRENGMALETATLWQTVKQAEETIAALQDALAQQQNGFAALQAGSSAQIATLQDAVEAGIARESAHAAAADRNAQLIERLSSERLASTEREDRLAEEIATLRDAVTKADDAGAVLRQMLIQNQSDATIVEADLLARIGLLQDAVQKGLDRGSPADRYMPA